MKLWTGFACLLLLAGSAMAEGGELVAAEWGAPGRTVDVTSRVRTFIHDGVLQLEVTRFNLGFDPAPHENKILIIRLREHDGDVKSYSFPERSTARLELHPENHERREEHERHDDAQPRDNGDRHEEAEHRDEARDRPEDADRRGDAERRDDGGEHHERRLQILRADYGAEGQYANVTEALRSQINDGRLFLHIDNDSMGVDPLPGAHKRLRVVYMIRGERRNLVVEEKSDLQLP
jgi:Domain of unknown function (DUF3395)